jgi:uncharacterized repeat protein (TIGR01451 family)/fimbrial isopeptide formation D2 family protein
MLISSPRYRFRFSLHHLRPLLAMAILIGGSGLGISPLLADVSAPPGLIKNTATGSFVDELDPTNTAVGIVSNEVSVTVIEVAGISISDPTITEPTATTIGATAAPFQGIGGINQDDILYFDFVITNKGNDPTQFFIPGSPFAVLNGTFDRTLYGAVQIIQITNAAGEIVPLPVSVSKIDLPAAGANTGDVGILGIPAGSISAGGSVTVRIPIKVTGGSGNSLKVTLGDTGANDNGVGTVNQTYTASTTTGADVHTHDNPNNTTLDSPVIGETDGVLATSAEKEASRYRIVSIVATPQVVGFKSAKLTDSNADNKINPGETVTWTIDYVNTGSIDVTNFQITDILPTGVTKSGMPIFSIGGSGQATPTVNSGYTGTNITPGTTDKLFTTAIDLKAGGMIKVTIPVTINPGMIGTLANQATATADNLPSIGIKTDNVGVTADLPTNIQTSVTVPTGSIIQTTTTAINPTTITVEAAAGHPNLLLVKRITAINGNTTNSNISLNSYDPELDTSNPAYPYDKNVIQLSLTPPNSDKWPNTSGTPTLSSTFLLGARNGGTIKPNDTVEYTIYFLSAGDSAAKNVLFCDRVPANVTFIPNAFNSVTADPSGLSTADRGIVVSLGSTLRSYTNINDNDIAHYYPPLSEPSNDFPTINCGGANTNGAVVVNLTDRPNALGTTADDATGAFGFVRFRGQMK